MMRYFQRKFSNNVHLLVATKYLISWLGLLQCRSKFCYLKWDIVVSMQLVISPSWRGCVQYSIYFLRTPS